jgi:REP element-mobilizing transposase RayT
MRRSPSRKSKPRQLGFGFRTWGGKRKGAGRKPRFPGRRRVPHRSRPLLASRHPVHVTLTVDPSLPGLRSKKLYQVLEAAFRAGKEREGFRLVQYSVQPRHLHLIVEAQDARALSRGLQGLAIRLARRLNLALGRTGRVFVDRYFGTILRTPRQTRNALCYVLNNSRRHNRPRPNLRIARGWIDDRSSGRWFHGWRGRGRDGGSKEVAEPAVAEARTWLLAVGWKRHGLISVDEVPGPGDR